LILVTGGRGFIGSHTTRALLDLGAPALPASRNPAPSPLLPGDLEIAQVDCTDPASLHALGERHTITAIVHLAAVHLGGATPLAELHTNARSTFAVLQAAERWNVGRVVMASTIGMYAGVEQVPWREDAPLPLASPHPIPAAKKLAEIVALASGLDVVAARIGGIWGPNGRPDSHFIAAPRMIHDAARQARDGHDSQSIDDHTGPAVRAGDGADILYARDCGAALALLATAPVLHHRVYNVGAGRATTNAEVASAIDAAQPDVVLTVAEGASTDAPIPYLDTTRLRSEGWTPAWPLQRAVPDYLAWLAAGHER
jgi:UDP-glucose 4-epimerase